MKRLDSCPSAQELEAALLADSSEQELSSLAAHLDECAACRERAEAITSQNASLEDDLHWAASVRDRTVVSIGEPLSKLNELLPDYDIRKEIGRGGMGIVYEAHQPKLNRLVAVKVLPALLGVIRPEAKARFRREAELAAGLDHTNIISIHDYGEADGTLFYAMQLIRGRSLRHILDEIEQSGAVDCVVGGDAGSGESRHSSARSGAGMEAGRAYYHRVAHWIADVADALQYAHGRGIIHRDIKPSNLLLADDGKLMISDFGLARMMGAHTLTASRSLVGTCRYMAPEQLAPDAPVPDRLVDIYSLGATLYEMLAFRPMFSGPDDRQVIHQIGTREPVAPHRIVRTVPRELETICLKATARDREGRYQTAGAFADDLRRWALGLPIEARRSSLPVRLVRLAGRHKMTVSLACVALVCVGLSGVLWGKYDLANRATHRALLSEAVERAGSLTNQARLLVDDESYPAAIALLDEAVATSPGYGAAHHLKAVALSRQGYFDEARTVLETAVAADAEDWRARYLLGMLLQTARDRSTDTGVFTSPVSGGRTSVQRSVAIGVLLAEVERLHPGSPEVYCLRSVAEPSHTRAIGLAEKALAMDPAFTDALIVKAERLGCMGQDEAALVELDAAIAAQRGGHRVHGLRGICLSQLGRWAEADAAFSKAIERNSHNVDWWYDRAVVRTYSGRFAQAVEDATRAIELESEYAFAYVARGRGLAGMGRVSEALADYNRAAEISPALADIYVERGLLYWNARDYTRSLADANRLIELEPDEARGFQRRAQTYLKLEQWDKALDDLARCDEINPMDAATPTVRGGVLFFAGRYAEAAASFAAGQLLTPNDYGNYSFHAISLVRLGRYHAAVAPLTEWISLANNRDLGLMRRGMVYEGLGHADLAIADYLAASSSSRLGIYPALWAGIACGLDGDAERAAEWFDRCEAAALTGSWTASILDVVRGTAGPESLRSVVRSEAQSIEAEYYAGVAYLLAGDIENARQSFENAVVFDTTDTFECDFARVRLRMLAEQTGGGDI